jgi:hypothetical protein
MAVPGSLWVQGTQLRFTSQSGVNFAYEGTYSSSPAGAKPGSSWIEGDNFAYIDQYGSKRLVINYTATNIPAAVAGSLWIYGNYLYWINTNKNKTYGHGDATHQNTSYNDGSYNDYNNSSTSHGDSTVTFQDSPTHGNHVPYHADWPASHTDSYNYQDTHNNSYHTDTPHADYPIQV